LAKLSKDQLGEFTRFAHELADLSGAAILPHFRKSTSVQNKAGPTGFDPVTVADKAAERVIRRRLAERFPDHGVIGEEFGTRKGQGRFDWMIDPIDGTRAFIMGYPLWGTLIGLVDRGEPTFGLMNQPFTRERFWSGPRGTLARDVGGRVRRLHTRDCPELRHAVLACTTPDMFKTSAEQAAFARVCKLCRMTRFGGDCYAYCLLAAGFIDVIVEAGLKPVDIVALITIVESAGGIVTTWDGRPATAGGRVVATGNLRLHEAAMAALAG
jgi:histidinol phosphatase-like enzyme (inositol monophosphatase family)